MRGLLLLLLMLLLGLQYRLWFGEGNLPAIWALQNNLAIQLEENEQLSQRNHALRAEVDDLRQGMSAIEERARSELGMIRQGETFFLLPEPSRQ